jgi:hypothetical protein
MIVTQAHLDHIIRRAQDFGARRLILFGSALETPDNARDIDLAADIPGMELYAFAGMLENELHCIIDIVGLDYKTPFIELVEQRGKVIYESLRSP